MYNKLYARDFILESIDVSNPYVNNEGKRMIVMIKANWCRYCVDFLPRFEEFSNSIAGFKFYILEQTENEALLNQWKQLVHPVTGKIGFPTLVVYNADGTPLKIIEDRFHLDRELKML